MKKFYVHYEGEPQFTMVARIEEDSKQTVSELLKSFAAAYCKKFPDAKLSEDLGLQDERKRTLKPNTKVTDVVEAGGDLFAVTTSPTAPKAAAAPSPQPASQPQPIPSQPQQSQSTEKVREDLQKAGEGEQKTKPQALDAETASNPAVQSYIKHSLSVAEASQAKGNYRHAVSIYDQVLSLLPGQKSCLYQLGVIWMSAKKYDTALKYLLEGTKIYPQDLEFKYKLGELSMETNNYGDALQYFSAAYNIALEAKRDKRFLDGLKVRIGRAVWGMGQQDTAAQVYTSILKEDEENVDALREYGKALIFHKKELDALHVFLRVLVLKSDDAEARIQLSDLIKGRAGVNMLFDELKAVPSSAAAFAFLATVIKEHGSVEECALLFEKALEIKPSSSSYALNLVHVLEVCYDYQHAFKVFKGYLETNKGTTLVSTPQRTLTAGEILEVIAGIDDINAYAASKIHQEEKRVVDPSTDICYTHLPSYPLTAPKGKEEEEGKKEKGKEKKLEPLDADQLDLLALYCTLVKVVFLVGALDLILPLAERIERIRFGRELHVTTIRNEVAYYCCIQQLMTTHPTALVPDYKPFYVAGDSHCLTSAWHSIMFRDEPRVLKPMLVTGLKMWHLRPESRFFPKNNFYNVVSTIPPGSDVLFLFGEIDCREGLVVSVEKCRYETIEEGAEISIQIFLDVLVKLQEKYHWNIYIHPIVPVLNETRFIVKSFNKILERKVKEANGFYWLDFFDKLLTPDGEGFNKDFELDGTHMNPTYLPLLAEALNRVVSPSSSSSS